MGNSISIQHYSQLTDKNWLQYALNNYENPHLSSLREFEEDIKRFVYITIHLNRYRKTGDANINSLLNHIIILINCFGPEAAKNLLFFKVSKEYHTIINTILYFLQISGSIGIDSIDPVIYNRLKEL